MKEEWRTIKDTDNKYSVSNLGNVKRNEHYTIVSPTPQHPNGARIFYKEKEVKGSVDSEGYKVVYLTVKPKKRIIKKVHRLVAEVFIPNPDNLPQVNHKDEDKTNNCINNLEWCTAKYNANYGNRNIRLTLTSGIKVAQYDLSGKLIKVWNSLSQAAQALGSNTTSGIRRVCKGEPGRNSYKGFIWKYLDTKVIGDSSLKKQNLKNKTELINMIVNTFSLEEQIELLQFLKNKVAGEK